MRRRSLKASAIFLVLVTIFLVVAFSLNTTHPVLVVAGEDSPFTWLSGVMLIVAATLSGTIAIRERWMFWMMFTVFFFLLAIDERFMIHEALKDRIIFSRGNEIPLWLLELPVIIGALTGLTASVTLFRIMDKTGRILLSVGVFFGLISVTFDIFSQGVVPEEISKLVAEIAVCLALLDRTIKTTAY